MTSTPYVARPTALVGFRAAVLATLFSIAYVIGQLAEWLGLLGSQGGPSSTSTPLGIAILLIPSLLLGSAFLVLLVSIDEIAPIGLRIWSRVTVGFATAYLVLISLVYFVQLTLVAPRLARGATDGIEMFLFVPFDSFLYAVDILGYSFMSVATLFAGQVFVGAGIERRARLFLLANGALLPFIALQMYVRPLIWIASLWAITFPAATWSLAIIFHRMLATMERPERNGVRLRGRSGVGSDVTLGGLGL